MDYLLVGLVVTGMIISILPKAMHSSTIPINLDIKGAVC